MRFNQKLGKTMHGAKGSAQIVGDAVGKSLQFANGLAQGAGPLSDLQFERIGVAAQLGLRFQEGGFGLLASDHSGGMMRVDVQQSDFPLVQSMWLAKVGGKDANDFALGAEKRGGLNCAEASGGRDR